MAPIEIAKQPPSGGCVLKPAWKHAFDSEIEQPPSGGCVLKPSYILRYPIFGAAATFGWLCVETTSCKTASPYVVQPPSGGCVLKPYNCDTYFIFCLQPPSGGCVLKLSRINSFRLLLIAATFGWLCVETSTTKQARKQTKRSHLRVAVC